MQIMWLIIISILALNSYVSFGHTGVDKVWWNRY